MKILDPIVGLGLLLLVSIIQVLGIKHGRRTGAEHHLMEPT